jgi:hypothetical protein
VPVLPETLIGVSIKDRHVGMVGSAWHALWRSVAFCGALCRASTGGQRRRLKSRKNMIPEAESCAVPNSLMASRTDGAFGGKKNAPMDHWHAEKSG